MVQENTSVARLEMRTSRDIHSIIKRAALLQHRTISEFVIDAAHKAAYEVIYKDEILALSREDQKRFAEALISPPKASSALARAFTRHEEMISDE